jgi:hypothetical protein
MYHFVNRFFLVGSSWHKTEWSRAEPLTQNLEMIELSQAKGSKLRNFRAQK